MFQKVMPDRKKTHYGEIITLMLNLESKIHKFFCFIYFINNDFKGVIFVCNNWIIIIILLKFLLYKF